MHQKFKDFCLFIYELKKLQNQYKLNELAHGQ